MRTTTSVMRLQRSSGGFTAVELTACVAVIALLTSAAIPQLRGVVDHSRISNEALALRLFLERAYAYTLTARESLTIECSEHLLVAQRKDGVVLSSHQISNGASLDLQSVPDHRLLLHPTIAASPATLTLRRADRLCQIIISLRGRFRVVC
jgi:type II secretory pathway pseudopilin PulG